MRPLLAVLTTLLPLGAVGAGREPVVRVAPPHPAPLVRGESAELVVTLVVSTGFHVQANPAASDLLIPLELEVEPACGVVPAAPRYPSGEPYRLEGSDLPLLVLGGTFQITVPVRVGRDARLGRCRLPAVLRYQACDARSCLFPVERALEIAVEIR